MATTKIHPSVIKFIKQLAQNNNRDWFAENKPSYLEEHAKVIAFADSVVEKMKAHDEIETFDGKKSLHRIYRDTRFSKDKTPYKNHFSGSMKRATKWLRGGYYFHLEPDHFMVAGGFWGPNSGDLKLIRDDIDFDDKPLRKIIADPVFIETFGELKGSRLKTAPRGFAKDHKAVDLLQLKQFIVTKSFSNKEATSDGFADQIVDACVKMRPFLNYMSEVLTTDANGLPIK